MKFHHLPPLLFYLKSILSLNTEVIDLFQLKTDNCLSNTYLLLVPSYFAIIKFVSLHNQTFHNFVEFCFVKVFCFF